MNSEENVSSVRSGDLVNTKLVRKLVQLARENPTTIQTNRLKMTVSNESQVGSGHEADPLDYRELREVVLSSFLIELKRLEANLNKLNLEVEDNTYQSAVEKLHEFLKSSREAQIEAAEAEEFEFGFVKDIQAYWTKLTSSQSENGGQRTNSSERRIKQASDKSRRSPRKRKSTAEIHDDADDFLDTKNLFKKLDEEIDLALAESFLNNFQSEGSNLTSSNFNNFLGFSINFDDENVDDPDYCPKEVVNEIEGVKDNGNVAHEVNDENAERMKFLEPETETKITEDETEIREAVTTKTRGPTNKTLLKRLGGLAPGRLLTRTVSCRVCMEEVETLQEIKEHLISHPEGKLPKFPYRIIYKKICGNPVEGAETLPGLKVYCCTYCHHVSNKISNIKQHLSGVHKDILPSSGETGFELRFKKGYEPGEEKNLPKKSRDLKYSDYQVQKCGICDFSSRWPAALTQHIMSVHQNGPGFRCEECDFETLSNEEYTQHIALRHKSQMYLCDQCDYQTSRQECLKKHIKFSHQGFRYTCEVCKAPFKCPAALKDHTNSVHKGKFYQCDFCDWKGSHRTGLQKHVKNKHKQLRVPCKECDYSAKDMCSLKKHINSKHDKTWLSCDSCSFKALENATIYKHKVFSHKLAIYRCTTCDHVTDDRQAILDHSRESHDLILDESGGHYFCSECDHKAKTKGALNKHKEHVHSSQMYCCSFCSYSSANPWTLRRHTKTQHNTDISVKDLRHKD